MEAFVEQYFKKLKTTLDIIIQKFSTNGVKCND